MKQSAKGLPAIQITPILVQWMVTIILFREKGDTHALCNLPDDHRPRQANSAVEIRAAI
ncbi:hypothetical protein GCM10008915_43350 [Bifidobacterium pullorum subsp. gallinarum]